MNETHDNKGSERLPRWLVLSVVADLPAGAVIVWCLAVLAVAFSWSLWPLIQHRDHPNDEP